MIVSKKFSIPVSSNVASDFTHRDSKDPYNQLNINEKACDFISNTLTNLNVCLPDDFQLEFSEIIYNAYDAYVKQKLEIGKHLDISIAIIDKDSEVKIEIRDNAGGFNHLPFDKPFSVDDIERDFKEKAISSGGEGVGLKNFSTMMNESKSSLFFSNTAVPEKGAVVTLVFPKNDSNLTSGISYNPVIF